MWNRNDITFFRKSLLGWFELNKRSFPWRKDNISNYELIISEILLQRTKAETVAKYYPVFFNKYPSWQKLSKASIKDLEEILKPLGLYKHRAKRLHKILGNIKLKMAFYHEIQRNCMIRTWLHYTLQERMSFLY